jgi:hypothetical protein
MDINDVLKNAKDIPSFQLERKLNELVRENYKYKNLGEKNKKLLLGYIKEYIGKIRKGYSITSETIRRDMLKLHGDREELDLTYEDLDDFREVLGMFKK